MSESERDALIKQNPAYGEIVCRCEEVSKGEILDALDSPLPVYTLDAIKRRCRPGMGRCQGGFCSPTVVKILAEAKGVSPEEIKNRRNAPSYFSEKPNARRANNGKNLAFSRACDNINILNYG